ncbi:MAG: hypothetical protein ABWY02_12380 [Telluria sp.]
MNTSPLNGKTDLVSMTVHLDGKAMSDDYVIESIKVTREVNRLGTARIVLSDGGPSQEEFALSESDMLVPGVRVQVRMGYHQDTGAVFKGIIVKHGVRVREDGRSQVVLTCTDSAVRLTAGRKSAVYRGQDESDIWQEVIEEQGLTLRGGGGAKEQAEAVAQDAGKGTVAPPTPDLVRYYNSDWDFILTRAAANGRVVLVDDTELAIAQPALTGNSCGLRLAYGESMMAFSAEMDACDQPGSVSGTVTFQGSALAVPGKTIELAGVGGRFNGEVYIARVEHTLERGMWTTEVGFGMSPRWFAASNPALQALPAAIPAAFLWEIPVSPWS